MNMKETVLVMENNYYTSTPTYNINFIYTYETKKNN